MSYEQILLLTATYNCNFTEWVYLCSGRDWNSVNTLIRLIFWQILSDIFYQRLKQVLLLKLLYFSQNSEYSSWLIRTFAKCIPACFGGHIEMLLIKVILCQHALEDTPRCSWSESLYASMFFFEDTLRCTWSGSFCVSMVWRTEWDAPDHGHSVSACFGGHIEMLLTRVIQCLHILEDRLRCSWWRSFCACMFWRTHRDFQIRVTLSLHVLEDTSRCSWWRSFCACMFWRTHQDAPDQGHSVPACFGGHIEMLLIRVILACMFWRTHWDVLDQGHSMPACFGGHIEMFLIRVILCLHVLEDTFRCFWSGLFRACMFWRTHQDAPDQGHYVPACFGGHIEMLLIRVILACMFWRTHWDAQDLGHSVPACFGGHIEMFLIKVILCLHVLEDTSRCSWSGSFCACMF